ncbi:MAG: PLDc_N domain-containing protein [Alphaproteobacteria bacterium]|nr:PLDc_N domain-containing protein [Alphaproteobacteria bacterium]
MGYSLVGLVVLILDILAIISILQSGLSTGGKALWILLVLVLPVIGMILWFVIGQKKVAV